LRGSSRVEQLAGQLAVESHLVVTNVCICSPIVDPCCPIIRSLVSQGRASTTYLQLCLSLSQSQALLSLHVSPSLAVTSQHFLHRERVCVKMTFLSALANHFLNNGKFYAFTVLVLGVALLVGQSIYAWYRLRHIKGPWHAGWSQLWLIDSVASGNMHWKYAQVCEKYGMVDEA
jgi:hypothetical protein